MTPMAISTPRPISSAVSDPTQAGARGPGATPDPAPAGATPLARATAFLRERGAGIGVEFLINFAGPFLIYHYGKPYLGDVGALIASSAPPIAWSLVEFAQKRRVDALSILVLAGIALSLVAFIGGGGARFLQLREKLVTVLIALAFLGSAAIRRPLIYYLARATLMRRKSSELESFEAMKQNIYFRRAMTIMTLVWGFGLLIDAGVSVILVFTLSVEHYLLVSPFVGNGTIGLLSLWTFWFVRRQRAKRAALETAALRQNAEPEA